MPEVKLVRELDAGNLHVQFDERGGKTEVSLGADDPMRAPVIRKSQA